MEVSFFALSTLWSIRVGIRRRRLDVVFSAGSGYVNGNFANRPSPVMRRRPEIEHSALDEYSLDGF